MTSLTIIITAVLSAILHNASGMRRVCYYTNWAQYRNGMGRYTPTNVDPTLCSHYIYAFATLKGNNLAPFEWNDESTPWSKGMYEQFQELKQTNPTLKTLLGVGGWNMGSGPFTAMVASPQSRAQFVQSAIAFLRKHGFDGLDLDWEYPANRGSPAVDRDRFTQLVIELRQAFEAEAAQTGQPRLLLSAAVAAGKSNVDTAYDVPQLNRYVDFFNVMTYDLHGSWETFTGHHSPLYPRASETGDQRYLNVDYVAKYWVQKGADPGKLNIGLATYGRSFTLNSPASNGLAAPTNHAGDAGQFTRENGFLSYYEICQMIQNGGQVHDDAEQAVRYVTLGDQWVGGEDEHTLTQKVCYIKQHGYGGVMVWAPDLDDFTGNGCGRGPYPLMHAINTELSNPTFNNCPSPSSQQNNQTPAPGVTQLPFPTNFPTQGPTQGPIFFPTQNPTHSYPQNPTQGPTQSPGAGSVFSVFGMPGLISGQPNTPAPFTPVQHTQGTQVPQTQNPYVQQTQGPYVPHTQVPTGVNSPVQPTTQRGFHCMNMPSDFYPSPYACDEYFICANQVSYRVHCALGLQYNPVSKHCDWPQNVHCINPTSTNTNTTATATQLPPLPHLTQPPLTNAPVMNSGQSLSASTFCASGIKDGAYRHPTDCSQYFICRGGTGTSGTCANGQVFSPSFLMCRDPYYVPACRPLQG